MPDSHAAQHSSRICRKLPHCLSLALTHLTLDDFKVIVSRFCTMKLLSEHDWSCYLMGFTGALWHCESPTNFMDLGHEDQSGRTESHSVRDEPSEILPVHIRML